MLPTRTFAAFLIAPLVPVILEILRFSLSLLYGMYLGKNLNVGPFHYWYIFMLELVVAFGLMIFVAVPVFWLLKAAFKVRFNRWSLVCLVGLIGFLFVLGPELFYDLKGQGKFTYSSGECTIILDGMRTGCGYVLLFTTAMKYALFGALAGFTFWMIYHGKAWHEAQSSDKKSTTPSL